MLLTVSKRKAHAFRKGCRTLFDCVTAWTGCLGFDVSSEYTEEAGEIFYYGRGVDLSISVNHEGRFNGCVDIFDYTPHSHLAIFETFSDLDTLFKTLQKKYEEAVAVPMAKRIEEHDSNWFS
jgi:hypothetical protein